MSSTLSAVASATSSSASSSSQPTQYRPVGIVLAVGSGLLIGSSFVLKKKGLLRSQAGHEAGEGVAYLKSAMWWSGMTMMIVGELCNFGAYAFVEAILVTPLGALSVVICAILSHFFLKEKLTLFGWIGCAQCILGAIIIALNGPQEQSVSTIEAFKKLFLAPWFLAYGGACIATTLIIIFFIAPKRGKQNMIWYIAVCSLIGGISVSCTQGLGACIVTTVRGENQFKNWFIYFLLAFVTVTLLTEIYYLNVALALFNTAMVTPTYYVMFTFCTLVTSVILYQGLKASAAQILTIALAFLVICTGIFILQMSKVDPKKLTNLDRKTTILLQAAQEEIKAHGDENDEEKVLEATEEPGMDAIVGRFGAVGGTVVRARRRATITGTGRRRGSNQSGDSTSRPRRFDNLRAPTTPGSQQAAGTSPLPYNGGEHTMSQLLSQDRLVASPLSTPSSEMKRASSIRFLSSTDSHRGNRDDNAMARTTSVSGLPGGTHPVLPTAPPTALVPTADTHLPTLNLPTPSLEISNPTLQSGGSSNMARTTQEEGAQQSLGADEFTPRKTQ